MDERNLEKLTEELTSCVICTFKYFEEDELGNKRIPKILECTHTFCDKCIDHHFRECNSKRISPVSNFPCPTCRKTIYVPLKGINAFPTDIKVKQITELLQNIKTTSGTKVQNTCQPCHFKGLKVEGKFLCLTCQKIFCITCRNFHQKLSFFANHTFFNLSDQRSTKGSADSNECQIHSSDLEYLCITCNKSLCCICAMMPEHRNHNMRSLTGGSRESITESIYEDIVDPLEPEPLDEPALKKQTQIAVLKQRKDQLLSEINFHEKCDVFKVCEDDMNKAYKEAKSLLKAQYQELMVKLKENKTNFDKVISKRDEIYSTIKSADKFISEFEKGRKGSSDADKIEKYLTKLNAFDEASLSEADQYKCSFKSEIKVHLGQLVKEENGIIITPSKPSRKTLPLPKLVKKSDENADRNTKSSTSSADTKSTSDKGNNSVVVDAVIKTLKSLRFNEKSSSRSTRTFFETSRYAVQNDMWPGMLHWETRSLPNLKNICFAESDEILIALDITCRNVRKQLVALRSSDGNPLDLDIEDSVDPLDRIKNLYYCNESKHLFLLCYKDVLGMIKKFKMTYRKNNMHCNFKCVETVKLMTINDPIAISVNKKMVAILESGGSKITVLNSKFEKISQTAEGDFSKASYLAIDRNDRIIVSDCRRKEIKVFKNNEMALKFSSTGPKGEELKPQGVVIVTKQNNILVADQALNCISLYNCDGNLLEVIVENVKMPWGICYSESKHFLAVADMGGLKVYKL